LWLQHKLVWVYQKTHYLLIIGSEFSTINTNQGETLAQKKSWQYSN
jgi:hypothetical protein